MVGLNGLAFQGEMTVANKAVDLMDLFVTWCVPKEWPGVSRLRFSITTEDTAQRETRTSC